MPIVKTLAFITCHDHQTVLKIIDTFLPSSVGFIKSQKVVTVEKGLPCDLHAFTSSDSLASIKSVFVHLIDKVDIQVVNFNV